MVVATFVILPAGGSASTRMWKPNGGVREAWRLVPGQWLFNSKLALRLAIWPGNLGGSLSEMVWSLKKWIPVGSTNYNLLKAAPGLSPSYPVYSCLVQWFISIASLSPVGLKKSVKSFYHQKEVSFLIYLPAQLFLLKDHTPASQSLAVSIVVSVPAPCCAH